MDEERRRATASESARRTLPNTLEHFLTSPLRLVALVALLFVFPVLLLGEVSASDTRERLRTQQLQTTVLLAERIAASVTDRATRLRVQLEVSGSQTPELERVRLELTAAVSERDLTRVRPSLSSFGRLLAPTFLRLSVFDRSGGLLAAVVAETGEASAAVPVPREFFPSLSESSRFLSDPYRDGGRGGVPLVAVDTTISRQTAWLVGEFDMRLAVAWLKPLLEPSDDAYVVDGRGRLLVHATGPDTDVLRDLSRSPLVAEALAGEPRSGQAEDPLGAGGRVVATVPLKEIGWHVLVLRSTTASEREVQSALGQLLVIRLILVALMLAGSYVIARTAREMLRQKRLLARANEQLDRANHEKTALLTEVQALNAGLESRVAAQVGELQRMSQLSRFLSPQVAELVSRRGAELDTHRRELSILFADVRGFTSFSETLEPEELIAILNEYLGAMTDVVFQCGGTLDKYLGDGVMAFFGDPVPQADHAFRAVRCGLAMQERLAELQRKWLGEGRTKLTMGVGINSGWVTVGTVGSSSRSEYTVIGDNVNLASRLTSVAGPGEVLLSEKTWRLLNGAVTVESRGELPLKGKTQPVQVYLATGGERASDRTSFPG